MGWFGWGGSSDREYHKNSTSSHAQCVASLPSRVRIKYHTHTSRSLSRARLSTIHVGTMSSLRNAVKRKTHKERAQPAKRRHLGLLEKKKDYLLRAKDYHRKQDRLRILREKAAMRNPDEFYKRMVNSSTKVS